MDPNSDGLLQKLLTGVLYAFLTACYWIMKLLLKRPDHFDPEHLIAPPDTPIPSLDLAQALNPKSSENKLRRFARSEDPYVRRAVLRNPAVPLSEIERIAREDPVEIVAAEAKRSLAARREFG